MRHAPPATKTEPILSVEKKHRWQINTPKPLLYAIWKEMKRRKIPWSLLRDAVLQATNKETDSEEKLHESEALEIMRQLGIAPRKV
ncbi:hypothetical protein IT570_03365 [Candidatus Sumerlaeota bacterium]|nr:hypothetical protein [Candidatus Sumerlaeota bacterium]